MRASAFLIFALVFFAGCAARKPLSISGADTIEVWDLGRSSLDVKPKRITDPTLVSQIVETIERSPGRWRSGDFTAPSGDLRLVFYRGTTDLDAVGVGKGFLVCGNNSGWLHKDISPALETKLRDSCR